MFQPPLRCDRSKMNSRVYNTGLPTALGLNSQGKIYCENLNWILNDKIYKNDNMSIIILKYCSKQCLSNASMSRLINWFSKFIKVVNGWLITRCNIICRWNEMNVCIWPSEVFVLCREGMCNLTYLKKFSAYFSKA